jgi:hypothetical protein
MKTMNDRLKLLIALAAPAFALGACGGEQETWGESDPSGSPVAQAEQPLKIYDISGKMVTEMPPQAFAVLRKMVEKRGDANQLRRLDDAYDPASGRSRTATAHDQTKVAEDGIEIRQQAIYADDHSVQYRTHHIKPGCTWTWYGMQKCPNPAYAWWSDWVPAGFGWAGVIGSNIPLDDIDFKQTSVGTPGIAPVAPAFSYRIVKAGGVVYTGSVRNNFADDAVSANGKRIVTIQLTQDADNPWYGLFAGNRMNTVDGAGDYVDADGGSITSNEGFDGFSLQYYWLF